MMYLDLFPIEKVICRALYMGVFSFGHLICKLLVVLFMDISLKVCKLDNLVQLEDLIISILTEIRSLAGDFSASFFTINGSLKGLNSFIEIFKIISCRDFFINTFIANDRHCLVEISYL